MKFDEFDVNYLHGTYLPSNSLGALVRQIRDLFYYSSKK